MLQTLRNAWKIPELRKKIIFTLIVLFIYRLGCWIPVPGVSSEVMQTLVAENPLFGLMDIISGGSFANFTLFALGISPYITASIIIQLLTVAIPALERMAKEDENGRQKLNAITRYSSIGLALIEAIGFIVTLNQNGLLVEKANWFTYIVIAFTVTTGAALVMWMGEQITQKGIGNGISLLIFVSIVARLPSIIVQIYKTWASNPWMYAIIAAGAIALIALITFIDLGVRRIPVQYAKQQKGRKLYGGQSTHLPLKVNSASVLPIIFAISFLTFPRLIAQFFPGTGFYNFVNRYLSGGWIYVVLYMLLIFAFTFFYTSITINPQDIAKNLQQYGGFVQGIRPGKPTTEYIKRISGRLTFFCAIFLSIVAIIPLLFSAGSGLQQIFSASSILIMVSVALETSKQLESQMLVRNYKGFLN
nr:preprotein translocase subunit SecY [bacterium]